ncbi:glycoside hydrolase family 6 protein [Streptosporangium sp. NPDC048047]|uniref:glycoside hydrolase family 6 protein n=1 Tax=Streptosporangium sp. NPDC048047 TaxID=3155748 RepID=UPI00341C50BA
MNRYGRATAVLAFALAAAACSGDPAPPSPSAAPPAASAGTEPPAASPGASTGAKSGATRFYVDADGAAARELRRVTEQGRTEEAALLKRIAERSAAIWIGDRDPHDRVRDITTAAQRAGRVPVLVAYHIPDRDCGQFSAGGAADAGEYRAWIARFAEGIGDRPAWVVVEPDALAHILDDCTRGGRAAERLGLLREAVQTLKRRPATRVYLDAGNAGWIADPAAWIGPMREAGVEEADGFAFNVSNFFTTEESSEVARRLSDGLGGAHFVIDTSRNGNGPLREGGDSWCNPKGRALGAEPTTRTGDERLDALLWVKRPGESDGECGRGEPRAGDWFHGYALDLARNTR